MKPARTSFALKLFCILAALSLTFIVRTWSLPSQVSLTLDMASSVPSSAQIFYDTGSGFNEQDSATVRFSSHALNSFEHFTFLLPRKKIIAIRFDPLTVEGQFVIRNAAIRNQDSILETFSPAQIQPFNQISSRTEGPDQVEFSTIPGANDPGVSFALSHPLDLRWMIPENELRKLLFIHAALFCAAFLVFLAQSRVLLALAKLWTLATCIHACLKFLAARLSNGSFLKVSAFTLWILISLFVLFSVASLLDLNGSSAALYSNYGNGSEADIWLGTPKAIRSDEWGYVTPDILNQYFRANRFGLQQSVLGNHAIVLTGNVPVKHVSELFRPQFWPFFVLPADYAFSMYWQAKGFILLTGIFLFLLWITRSNLWALTGALWYFFSPFTQWTYSWPSALPEMVGSLCLGIVCFCYLTVGRNGRWLFLCALGAALGAINFTMCCYPPHQIPLVWLAIALLSAWFVAARKHIFTRDKLAFRAAALSIAVLLVAAVGLSVFADLKFALSVVQDTLYPGRRVLPGATRPVWAFAAQLLPWTESDRKFPALLGNVCEGSGFLWLAPLSLLCLSRLTLTAFQKAALAGLWTCALALFCWCAFPMPYVFGQLTLLNRCAGARCIPALGLANIAIVALTMASFQRRTPAAPFAWRKHHIAYLFAFWVLFFVILQQDNHWLNHHFHRYELVVGSLFLAILTLLLITGKGTLLAASLVFSQALAFGSINPIERGLGELTQSAFTRYVQSHRDLLQGKWLVFSDAPVRSGFVAQAGCQVYTGTRYMPDVDHFPLFASRGLDLNTFNRLGFLDAHAIPPGQPTSFILENPVVVQWNVSPTDPMLKSLGITYLAFDFQPSPTLTAGLSPLSPFPIDGLWLYRIDR